MKLKLSFILALITALIFTGCSLSPNGSDLLHPPKTTGNEAEIEQLIESTAKGSYMLKYPNNGDYRSAIITKDFDKDGKDTVLMVDNNGEVIILGVEAQALDELTHSLQSICCMDGASVGGLCTQSGQHRLGIEVIALLHNIFDYLLHGCLVASYAGGCRVIFKPSPGINGTGGG